MYKPVVLVILDGYGRGPENAANAIFKAKKPNIDSIEKNYPMTNLQASGIAAGLPWGDEGSSEVGHLNLGAGRIVYQYLPRITFAIRDGSFFQLPALTKLVEHIKKNNSAFHIMGLIGGGNVHSYIDHFYGVLEFAKKEDIKNVFIHAFTDGRDSPPRDALDFYDKIQKQLNENYPFAKIASLIGRHFAMDRDNHWDRTEKTYRLLTESKGEAFDNARAAIKSDYDKNITDEFIEPKILVDKPIKENDAVIFIDFREDSARQLSRAFVAASEGEPLASLDASRSGRQGREENFNEFPRKKINNLYFAAMTRYEKNLPFNVLFEPLQVKNTLAEIVAKNGKNQIHIAETEKYAHVTYFFNGGEETAFPNEDRILISTKRDHDFSEDPAMSASEVTEKLVEAVNSKKYDLIVANYANADMVGHTGNFQATVSAIEILDNEIGRLMPEVLKTGGILIITSDHGNADEKINPLTGIPQTEHSANPVPFYLIGNDFKREKAQEKTEVEKFEVEGILADVAPTVLELLGLSQPSEMTGKSLLKIIARE